jgi:hypothetical protein
VNETPGRSITWLGLICVVTAVVGGGVKLVGSELPIITSFVRQVLLAVVGVSLIAWDGWPRRKLVGVFLVQQPTPSFSRAVGTLDSWQVKTTRFGGHVRRIEAADYHRTADGKAYVFTDRYGRSVCELPSYQVDNIRRESL